MRTRLFISLGVAAFLLWHAFEQFSMQAGGIAGVFAIVWFVFALLVVGGNLSALLHERHKKKSGTIDTRTVLESRKAVQTQGRRLRA
ncbi:hypothetical protein [Natribacillus halophilus]|uniref:Uncharacterized protein n=1 Tax=Natribacillus halophilus TaxID=549003 RepID=A0A1G8ND58_9BACI|nr:hypothetical protein [Natribacillus halophilus]SDI78098.1 hypothetical protein SAMN04488123_10616 [Natribacillus halophilus]